MTNENLSPDAAAQILRNHPTETKRALATSDGPYSVCLLYSNGVFIMTWSAGSIGDYDWVALYSSTDDANDKYVTYQWAKNGPFYNTGTYVQYGYQARYLIWDKNSGQYVVVASTPAFPKTQVCSS